MGGLLGMIRQLAERGFPSARQFFVILTADRWQLSSGYW